MTTKQSQQSQSQPRPVSEHKKGHSRTGSRNLNRRSNNASNSASVNGISPEIFASEEYQHNANDRLLFLIANSIGCEIEVQVNSGDKINGVLESVDPKTLQVLLKKSGDEVMVSIAFADLIDFEVRNVDLFNPLEGAVGSGGFKTDTETSKIGQQLRQNDIEKWVPEEEDGNGVNLGSLTLESSSSGGHWDQFQTNEEKFGIKSEFDENLYTTRINKNDPNYAKNLEKANKLAKEIEGQSFNGNHHLAEERGLKFDDSGIDEEDKYSGVDRTSEAQAKGDALFASLIKRKAEFKPPAEEIKGKYVPPSQRHVISNIDPAIVSASKQTTSTSSAVKSTPPPASQTSTPKQSTTINVQQPSTIPPKPSVNVPTVKQSSKEHHGSKKIVHKNELESLKEFSQNFKVPSKFPADLLPIISKDKHKQEEIIKRYDTSSSSSAETKTNTERELKSPPVVAESAPITEASATFVTANTSLSVSGSAGETPSTGKSSTPTISTKKFNPKASSFTPTTTGSPRIASPTFQRNSPRVQHKKRPNFTSSSFFVPNRLPNPDKPRNVIGEFNFFKGCLNEYKRRDIKNKFRLEKPYVTPPTWFEMKDDPTFEKPYLVVFAELEEKSRTTLPSYGYPYQQFPPQFQQFPGQPQQVHMFPPQQMPYQQYPSIHQRFGPPGAAPVAYGQQFQPMPFIQGPPPPQQYYYQGGPGPAPVPHPQMSSPPHSNSATPVQPMMSPPQQQQPVPHPQQPHSPQFYQQRPSFPVVGAPPVAIPGGVPPHPGSQGRGFNASYKGGYNGGKSQKNNR